MIKSLKILFLSLLLFSENQNPCFGQARGFVFGTVPVSSRMFGSLQLDSGIYSLKSSIGQTQSWSGTSTYDYFHNRYIFSNFYATIIVDAATGKLYDSIPNGGNLYSAEYDSVCDCLRGFYNSAKGMYFASLDVKTKVIKTIHSAQTYSFQNWAGLSTYDRVRRRHITISDGRLLVLDSTGALADTVPMNPYLSNIEYDPITDNVYGIVFPTNNSVSVEYINLNTRQTGVVNTFARNGTFMTGESCFDITGRNYITRTDQDILAYNVSDGSVAIYPVAQYSNNLTSLEFGRIAQSIDETSVLELKATVTGITVYPNPGRDEFTFSGTKPGDQIYIYDSFGRLIFQSFSDTVAKKISMCDYAPGLYHYTLLNQGGLLASGTLIRE